ncbi:hypothetical protein [Tistrella mobilis]|uniref:hypothetical protein n=1 Tax=Tistrella mobilis TaxID=171437 RepID=UPI0035580BEE
MVGGPIERNVIIRHRSTGRLLGLSTLSVAAGQQVSLIGIPDENGARNKAEVIWKLVGQPPIMQELSLINEAAQAYVGVDPTPLDTHEIPVLNAVGIGLTAGEGAPAFLMEITKTGQLLSLGHAQYLNLRRLGAVTAVWAPMDSPRDEVEREFEWEIVPLD